MRGLIALCLGVLLDLLLGDPPRVPHLVVGMGRLITSLERVLRKALPSSPKGELFGGGLLAALVCGVSLGAAWGLIALCALLHPALRVIAEALLCWQCLALKELRRQSMAVYAALRGGDLPAARAAVGKIVGRDVQALNGAGVARAAVETVAENVSDGVIAPLVFLALGGAPLGVLYKAVNTMDSMVGYQNDRYLYFGRAAARLDDAANLVPSRLSALLMVVTAPLAGLDGPNAWRIFRRDRFRHKSPNSAQTESACAGALHLQLGGDAVYFGKRVIKPTIGDDDRPVEPEDIPRANRLAAWASGLCLALALLGKGVFLLWN